MAAVVSSECQAISPIQKQEALKLLAKVYRHANGYGISKSSRNEEGWETTKALTYGEVLPKTFDQILSICKPQGGGCFVDLGSGTGLAVATAAVSGSFSQSRGIEIIPGLHECACTTLDYLKQQLTLHSRSQPPPEVSSASKPHHSKLQGNKPKKQPQGEPDPQVLMTAVDDLLLTLSTPTPLDTLSRAIVEKHGAKFYRQALKGSGNLRKFLRRRPDQYLVDESDEGVFISKVVSEEREESPTPTSSELKEERGVTTSTPALSVALLSRLEGINLQCGDIFVEPWWECEGDIPPVVYAASLLFDETMMTKLADRVEQLPLGSTFVSLKRLRSSALYELFHKDFFSMSWKMPSEVFFYRRVSRKQDTEVQENEVTQEQAS